MMCELKALLKGSILFGAVVLFIFLFGCLEIIIFCADWQLWLLCRTYWKEQQREVERVVPDPSPSYCRRTLEHSTVYPVTNKKNILKIKCSPGQVLLHNINKLYYQWSSVDITHNSQQTCSQVSDALSKSSIKFKVLSQMTYYTLCTKYSTA